MLQAGPQQEGYTVTCWTVAMLLLALAAKLKVHLSLSAIRSTLHHMRLRWGRPRLSMPDKVDPDKAQKQWAMVKAVVTPRRRWSFCMLTSPGCNSCP